MSTFSKDHLSAKQAHDTSWFAIIFFSVCVAFSFLPFVLGSHEAADTLSREDNFYEWFGAFCLLLSSIILMLQYVLDQRGNDFLVFRTRRNVFIFGLALLFFFGFGEEISWGQRILNYRTPEFFLQYNMQQEVNIHNLSFLHGQDENYVRKTGLGRYMSTDFLFSVFWFSFAIALPITTQLFERIRRAIQRINIPIPPLWIGALMISAYAGSKAIEQIIPTSLSHSLTEVKECNLELLLYAYSLFLFGKSAAYKTVARTFRQWHQDPATPYPAAHTRSK